MLSQWHNSPNPLLKLVHIQIPPTGYVGLIWHSTIEATASYSTVEGTYRVRCSYRDSSNVHAVAAAYSQSTLKGTPNSQ